MKTTCAECQQNPVADPDEMAGTIPVLCAACFERLHGAGAQHRPTAEAVSAVLGHLIREHGVVGGGDLTRSEIEALVRRPLTPADIRAAHDTAAWAGQMEAALIRVAGETGETLHRVVQAAVLVAIEGDRP